MLVNSSCTLYRWNESKISFDRIYIPQVYWRQTKSGRTRQSGDHSTDGTTVYLYNCTEPPLSPEKDMLVKGKCSFEFTGGSDSIISSELKQFRRSTDFVVVYSIADYMVRNLQHDEIYAE